MSSRIPSLFLSLGIVVGGITGCVDAEGVDPADSSVDGKADGGGAARDSHQRPTDHGDLQLGVPASSSLTARAGYHAWQFDVFGPADVAITTGPATPGGRQVDTVLYLYRETARGWGSYVAKNDNARSPRGTKWSAIDRHLEAGRYRVLIKGQTEQIRGKFAVTVACTGAGCAAAPAEPTCVFGDAYNELDDQAALQVSSRRKLTAASPLSELDARRVVLAVQQSSHTDVTTAAEAFARVDQGEINRVDVYEPAAARTFVVLEYGAGDNSYGAYFDGRSDAIVASIHDGDLLGCATYAETCLLGQRYRDLLSDPAFAAISSRRITEAGHAVGVEAEQALLAVQEIWPDVTTLAEALDAVQDHEINVTGVFHTATGTQLIAFEYGAGDNSFGVVFYAGSLVRAATINDGDFYGCQFFAARGGAQVGEACLGPDACGEGLTCQGPFAGAGRCAPTAVPPGEGLACESDAACGAGLICSAGACRPSWMRGTFSDVADAAIPDGGILTRRLAVNGLATVDTAVEVRATFAHAQASQLRVTLTNPATTEVLVHDGTVDDDGDLYLVLEGPVSGFSGDESVNGEWLLRVEDRASGATGRLVRWDLTITSRWD